MSKQFRIPDEETENYKKGHEFGAGISAIQEIWPDHRFQKGVVQGLLDNPTSPKWVMIASGELEIPEDITAQFPRWGAALRKHMIRKQRRVSCRRTLPEPLMPLGEPLVGGLFAS